MSSTPSSVSEILIDADAVELPGTLTVPSACRGIVVFAHGSGSSRLSPRNRQVAEVLNAGGCGTLLFDLLTEDEGFDRARVFDIELLGRRMCGATRWIRRQETLAAMPLGFFGASTGAAAGLVAAAAMPAEVAAVVSRGGRPDLAGDALASVSAPTLLIVGSLDGAVLDMNRKAMARMRACDARLVVIEGADHLFEEPGTLEQAAAEAAAWFGEHLGAGPSR